jgi:hypothetical protein
MVSSISVPESRWLQTDSLPPASSARSWMPGKRRSALVPDDLLMMDKSNPQQAIHGVPQ